MASIVYNGWKGKDGNSWAAAGADAVQAMLVTADYTPNPDHRNPDDGPAAAEVTGGTYARKNIANRAVTIEDANDRTVHTADNPLFEGLVAAEVKYVVLYLKKTDDTDHALICCLDVDPTDVGLVINEKFMPLFGGGATNGVVFRGT